jgi:hypothetical protein
MHQHPCQHTQRPVSGTPHSTMQQQGLQNSVKGPWHCCLGHGPLPPRCPHSRVQRVWRVQQQQGCKRVAAGSAGLTQRLFPEVLGQPRSTVTAAS